MGMGVGILPHSGRVFPCPGRFSRVGNLFFRLKARPSDAEEVSTGMTRRKKLLITVTEYPPMVSGVCTLTDVFVRELAKNPDLELHLWAPPGSCPPPEVVLHPSYFRRRSFIPRIAVELYNGITLKNLLRSETFDGVLFMDASSRAYGFGFVPKVKSLIYVHGHEVKSEGWFRDITTMKLSLQIAAMKKADIVLANSDSSLQRTLQVVPEALGRTVYPCYDPMRIYDPERHASNPFEEGPFIFLTVARVVERKGHETILRMLQKIGDQLDWRYYIVGDGPIRADLEALADDLGLSSRVRFTGAISDQQLGAYYHHADLMVMLPQPRTGGFEGFGLSYIEAALSDTASVGSHHGGVKEAVVHGLTGLIVDPERLDETTGTVLDLARDKPRMELYAKNGRERTLAEFSPEVFAEKILAALSL